jgi:hypothetical protein
MWASQPVKGHLEQFQWFNGQSSIYTIPVAISLQPEFHTFAFTFREQADRAWITLGEGVQAGNEPVDLYFDGVVLLEGEWSGDQPPVFATNQGDSGTWQGERFSNLARNGSAESAWPFFRPQVEAAAARLFSDPSVDSMTVALSTALDPAAGWYYSASARSLLQTFWGKFGWAHVPLAGHKPYRLLGVLTLVGIAGAVLALWRQRRKIHWNVLVVLGAAAAAAWGLALVRGTNYLLLPIRVYLPVARYVFPAAIPSALILCLGWLQWLSLAGDRFRVPAAVRGSVLLLGLASLDIYALVSLLRFYGAYYR